MTQLPITDQLTLYDTCMSGCSLREALLQFVHLGREQLDALEQDDELILLRERAIAEQRRIVQSALAKRAAEGNNWAARELRLSQGRTAKVEAESAAAVLEPPPVRLDVVASVRSSFAVAKALQEDAPDDVVERLTAVRDGIHRRNQKLVDDARPAWMR